MMKSKILVYGAILFAMFMNATAGAVPQWINYQARLTDEIGQPVPDRDYAIVFTLYDAPVGGNVLWSETHSTVEVINSIFSVLLNLDSSILEDDLFLGITVEGDSEMTPRQPLTSVPFALKAKSVAIGAVNEVMLADGAVTTVKLASGAITADKIVGGDGSYLDADTVDGLDAASFAPSAHDHDASYYPKAFVDALVSRIEQLEAKLQYLTVTAGAINGMNGPNMVVNGANLHVRSGNSATDASVNGLGNLIVGYNELRGNEDDRSGSHNIVVGRYHNYSSFGGFVAGNRNEIAHEYASVSGGTMNVASGDHAHVSSGFGNIASGNWASVVGGGGTEVGDGNTAFGDFSSILGGRRNIAGDPDLLDHSVGIAAIVGGGFLNTASGQTSTVSGGLGNTSYGQHASISGGQNNLASALGSHVSGGRNNTASGDRSSISGGYSCEAIGDESSVSGGASNTASGPSSAVSGGSGNEASSIAASVSGGEGNVASGYFSSVSGGASLATTDIAGWRAPGH